MSDVYSRFHAVENSPATTSKAHTTLKTRLSTCQSQSYQNRPYSLSRCTVCLV